MPERALRKSIPYRELQVLALRRRIAELTGRDADPKALEAYFSAPRPVSERPAAKSGERRLTPGGGGALTIAEAVATVCQGVWLSPEEICTAVEEIRPGTKRYEPPGSARSPFASIYPELKRGKDSGVLLHRGGKYKTA